MKVWFGRHHWVMRRYALPLAPGRFGRTRQIVLGKHSGRAAVKHALTRLGLCADESHVKELLARIRAYAVEHKRALLDQDLLQLYAQTLLSN